MPRVDEESTAVTDEPTSEAPAQEAPKEVKPKKPPRRPAEKVYPVISEKIMRGADAMTVDQAKEYLGWKQVEKSTPKCSPAIKAVSGLDVILEKCHKQRWLDDARWLRTLRQDHLNRKFPYNGKTVILGDYGAVLDGMYRMASLICAEHERTNGLLAKYWQKLSPEPLRLETILVCGLDEDDDMFATFNAVLSGTPADTIFRSDVFQTGPYSKCDPTERKALSKIAEYAVRTLWDRTGGKMNAWAPDLNVLEAIEFLRKHPSVRDCCYQIWTEDGKGASKDDGGGAVSNWLSRGYAAGLCYLFGVSKSDPAKYLGGTTRSEKLLDTSLMDKAFEFWVYMGSQSTDAKPLRDALNDLILPNDDRANREQVAAVLCKAWNFYRDDKEFTRKDIFPRFVNVEKDEEGNVINRRMDETCTVGGVDLGSNPKEEEKEDDKANDEADDKVKDKAKTPAEKGEPKKGTSAKDDVIEQLATLRKKHPGQLMIFKTTTGVYAAWEDDADTLVRQLGVKMNRHPSGLDRCFFPSTELEANLAKLVSYGNEVTVFDTDYQTAIRQAKPGDSQTEVPKEGKDDRGGKPKKGGKKGKKKEDTLKGGIG